MMKALYPILIALSLMPNLAKSDETICDNKSNGLPIAEGNYVVCDIRKEFTSFEGRSIIHSTSGLARKLNVNAKIKFELQPTEPEKILRLNQIMIPEQIIGAKLSLVEGPDLDVSIGIQPTLNFTGKDICSIQATGISVNITRFGSSLEDWLDNIIRDYFNEEQLFAETLSSLQKQVIDFQKINCTSDSPSTPINQPWKNHDGFRERLVEKYFRYIKFSAEHLDEKGWMEDTYCDGLLFNSLRAVAGAPVDMFLAEDPQVPGRFYRNWRQDCYKNHLADKPNSSKSTISRDMLIGFLHWTLSEQRADLATNLVNYGKSRSIQGIPLAWVVGEGQIGRAEMPPGLIQNAYDVIEKITGTPSPLRDVNFQVWSSCNGYPCHLQTLAALLRWRLDGQLSSQAMTTLEAVADREIHNAMYNAVYGRIAISDIHIERAYQSLLNEQWFPGDRLPSNRDRKGHYIFERDYIKNGSTNPSWLPSDEPKKVYSGTDFLFAAATILGVVDGGLSSKQQLAKELLRTKLNENLSETLVDEIIVAVNQQIQSDINPLDIIHQQRQKLASEIVQAVLGFSSPKHEVIAKDLLDLGLNFGKVRVQIAQIAIAEIFSLFGAIPSTEELEVFSTSLLENGIDKVTQDIRDQLIIAVFQKVLNEAPDSKQFEWAREIMSSGGTVSTLETSLRAVDVQKIAALNDQILWNDHIYDAYQATGYDLISDTCNLVSFDFRGILTLKYPQTTETLSSCLVELKKGSEHLRAKFFILQRPNPVSRVVLAERETKLRYNKAVAVFDTHLDVRAEVSSANRQIVTVSPKKVQTIQNYEINIGFSDDYQKTGELFVLPKP
ncbi:hypothetical protein [Pseudobacteriovorax antillogorgiicola]|uniref:Uncharacterized protein n=1 Tax=Pseudobacteriovorax antillogorgiicola TaxID=1513793 RepID=A0A1Y6BX96_9BACT|nr:hypothetical protein [Pseudobacteriovorax antillogorgiicola]TCS53730.1 hypothetical protein EDD56_10739 [Pseudobacteriovorax antillogorgiicola]SMF22751.1 hypothetical protein SAMN06296036_107233 [Pseudobacteriovorax antillogorgiicola]